MWAEKKLVEHTSNTTATCTMSRAVIVKDMMDTVSEVTISCFPASITARRSVRAKKKNWDKLWVACTTQHSIGNVT
jgi:hypothetical protein